MRRHHLQEHERLSDLWTAQLCGWLARLRLELKANNVGTRCISQADSAVKSFAIPTDEQIVIAPGRAFRWPASELDLRGVEAFTR